MIHSCCWAQVTVADYHSPVAILRTNYCIYCQIYPVISSGRIIILYPLFHAGPGYSEQCIPMSLNFYVIFLYYQLTMSFFSCNLLMQLGCLSCPSKLECSTAKLHHSLPPKSLYLFINIRNLIPSIFAGTAGKTYNNNPVK